MAPRTTTTAFSVTSSSSAGTVRRPRVMLGQKRELARGKVVEDKLAHSFRLGASPELRAKKNRRVTRALFEEKQAALRRTIVKAFGARHPVSGAKR